MNPVWIILIIVLVLIYIISPIDGVPDMVPLLGWVDDTLLMGLLIYYLRYRRLPGFLTRLSGLLFTRHDEKPGSSGRSSAENQNHASPGKGAADDLRSPWDILGVAPGASEEEVHSAYRKLVQQYHPDKVAHLGKEFQDLAQKKFVQIQEAYNILTRKTS